ncbi:MAG TPA: alpha/beta hydrolase [Mycobacteriales bacterium]|nr:alpha/beta hydrolase [Mycobacteriales bacterium]
MADSRYVRRGMKTKSGMLMIGEWAGAGMPVLAIHGISSTHLLWQWTAAAAPGVRIIAPDLRGRGNSVDVPGPYGLLRHRDDVLAVMDFLRLEKVVLAGMSMGGFVATAVANAAPDRVSEVVLVDGGAPMALPPSPPKADGEDGEPLSDRLERTQRTFARVEDYRRTFLAGVGALLDPGDPLLTDYLRYDLAGQAPELEVRLEPDAVRQDAADVFGGAPVADWMAGLRHRVTLLHAEWSVGVGSPPAYPASVVESWCARLPKLRARLVPGVDHAGIVMTAAGAKEVAVELERATAS